MGSVLLDVGAILARSPDQGFEPRSGLPGQAARVTILLSPKKLEWAESSGPFFLLDRLIQAPISEEVGLRAMSWQGAVETTVTGLGYELVDAEKGAGGLLRVFIDVPFPGQPPLEAPRAVTVDDCERVTRQLQHVLEVEGCAYERLEVSSPGLDRPLKRAADYARFAGEQVELTLRLPFKGRKKYRGVLVEREGGWRLLLEAGGGADAEQRALDFVLDEVREAKLVPVVDFKGRRTPAKAAPSRLDAAGDEVVDGGRIQ
jgi:ribosome maturation factor RimP